jgi:hypothetical protein
MGVQICAKVGIDVLLVATLVPLLSWPLCSNTVLRTTDLESTQPCLNHGRITYLPESPAHIDLSCDSLHTAKRIIEFGNSKFLTPKTSPCGIQIGASQDSILIGSICVCFRNQCEFKSCKVCGHGIATVTAYLHLH